MYFFHVNYEYNFSEFTHVLKSDNILKAMGKWLFNFDNNLNIFLIMNHILHDAQKEQIEEFYELNTEKNVSFCCIRSNMIDKNNLSYNLEDAIEITYQNLQGKTKLNLSKDDVEYILDAFYQYKEENGFVINDDDYADEDSALCFDADEVCPYVQLKAIADGMFYQLDDINDVFEAETEYLIQAELIINDEKINYIQLREVIDICTLLID